MLGSHLPRRGMPIAAWAYQAEVYDDVDPAKPIWACTHNHESPQQAHGCAVDWVEASEESPESLTEQTG